MVNPDPDDVLLDRIGKALAEDDGDPYDLCSKRWRSKARIALGVIRTWDRNITDGARFKVIERNNKFDHSNFDATVIDTLFPIMIGNKHYHGQYREVCKCFERDDAVIIAATLNLNAKS